MRWTNNEIELLRRDYVDKGEFCLSSVLNRSPNAIRIMASRDGISKLAYRKDIKLSESEKQIILGGLFGDLYSRIKDKCKNARIEGAHCKKQEKYLLWKVNMLKSLSFNLRRNKLGYLSFESRRFPCLNYYHNLFYKNGKKEVTRQILDLVDRLGLAVWYMDDGSYKKRDRNCTLHTNGFTYAENLVIKEWFEEKWSIFPSICSNTDPKRHPGKRWHYLYFGTKEAEKFISLIKDYIHPSMLYKIGVFKKELNGGGFYGKKGRSK